MDIFDLARVLWPVFVIAPLTLRTLGTWSWAAWLPPRLRALENRRALAFVEKLVDIVAAEKESKAPVAVDERALREEFVEAADGISRVLPESAREGTLAAAQPVSDRLRVITTKALERALANGLRGSADELARRDRLARACLEILRKLPSPANTSVLREALHSANPAIVRQTTSVIAAAPRVLRAAIAPSDDVGDGEHKIYRAR